MRVLCALLSLLCLSGVSAQYALLASSSVSNGYNWNTTSGANPPLSLTAGNSYTFDISASPQHPFAFSSAENSGTTNLNALDANVFNVTVGSACTTASNGYVGTGCILTLAINANATNQTIWYKCTVHSPMTGPINILAAPAAGNTTNNATTDAPTTAAPTTAAPTTAAPTTAAPTNNTGNATTGAPTTGAPTTAAPTTGAPTSAVPITGGTILSNSFRITGNSGPSGYIFTHNGVQYVNPTLNVTAGLHVTISLEWVNSKFHPLGLSFNSNSSIDVATLQTPAIFPPSISSQYNITTPTTCNTAYFTAFKTIAQNSTAFCVISIPSSIIFLGAPTTYYRCAVHPLMVGAINVVAAAPGSSTGGGSNSSSSSTGSASSSTGKSSTGGNTASTITLSGLTMVFAMIVAIMA